MISSIIIIHKLKIKKQKNHQTKKLKIIIIYIIIYIKIILDEEIWNIFGIYWIELSFLKFILISNRVFILISKKS